LAEKMSVQALSRYFPLFSVWRRKTGNVRGVNLLVEEILLYSDFSCQGDFKEKFEIILGFIFGSQPKSLNSFKNFSYYQYILLYHCLGLRAFFLTPGKSPAGRDPGKSSGGAISFQPSRALPG
jgi:hypothetical protein